MDVRNELERRQADRVSWLQAAVAVWDADERVIAAWLWGSGGRGTDDALSDWDLFVALEDAPSMTALSEIDEFRRFGEVLWVRENAYNAPADGRCFSLGYPATFEPLAIDWYVQPYAAAVIGTDTRVLVEKQPVPRADCATFGLFPNVATQTAYELPEEPADRLSERLHWFWFMFSPLSKWIARRDEQRIAGQLAGMCDVLSEAVRFLNHTDPTPIATTHLTAQVRRLADEMTRLHPDLSARHVRIPDTSAAYEQLATAVQIQQSGWTR